jgi:DNA-binding LytR/AlgR family response regulator
MVHPINILIVEDNVLIAEDAKMMLESLGYSVVALALSYEEGLLALKKYKLDLVLIDIQLNSDKTGIDIARHLRKSSLIPFIFVTSNSDKSTVEEVKTVQPNGYLIKPFDKDRLFTTIETVMSKHLSKHTELADKFLFIKKEGLFHKILFDEICYVKADNVYLEIITLKTKHIIRSTLKDFLMRLPKESFFRTSKSYIINLNQIDAFGTKDVIINGTMIPISKDFQITIKKLLNLK